MSNPDPQGQGKIRHLRADGTPSGKPWVSLEWVSPEEAANWLRINVKLIYRLCKDDNTFPAVQVGRAIRIRRSRLERWLERHHPAHKPLVKLPAHSVEATENSSGEEDAGTNRS